MTHYPVPKDAPFLRILVRAHRSEGQRWTDSTGERFYEWDGLHGELEVYNSRGRHLGAVDPSTGRVTKPAERGRSIDV